MAVYMVQFSYTPQALAAFVKKPQDRSIASRDLVQQLGGKLISLYYCLGEYDGIALYEVPDDISASAVSLAVRASGDFKENKTTRLFTIEEALQAVRKAGSASFSPPTS